MAEDTTMVSMRFLTFVLLHFLCLSASGNVNAEEEVVLATMEMAPYSGKDLPNKGYAVELVTEAFDRVGYKVLLNFYPLARAKRLAETGIVDGFLPAHFDRSMEKHFAYSDPFPGNKIGLLKRKSLPVSYAVDPQTDLNAALQQFRDYTFGIVRGTSITQALDQGISPIRQYVARDLSNIDMLERGRIHFSIIDKYTAADLLVTERPQFISKLEFLNPPLIRADFHVAFSMRGDNYEKLNDDFNRGLRLLREKGRSHQILEKHGFFQPKNTTKYKKKLVIGAIETDEIQLMQRISVDYEKANPNIVIEWRILDETTLRKRLLADLAIADAQFDIMMIGSYEVPIWSKNGWLEPIAGLSSEYDLDDVVDSVRSSLTYQNELYALPFYAESTMTFYRKDLFDKADITMPSNPTYEDIMHFAEAVHDPENGVYGIGLRGKPGWGQNVAFISILVNTFGGRWFDENWRPTINSKAWRDALTYYKEILDKFGHPNKAENGWHENQKLFSEGKLAIIIDATSLAGRIFNPRTSSVYDKVGFAAAPYALQPKGSQWLWAWSFAIPVTSALKDEAANFISWATSKRYIDQVAMLEGRIAVPPGSRVSTYDSDYEKVAPFSKSVINAIKEADPADSNQNPVPYRGIQYVEIPEFPTIGHQVGLKIVQYLEGKISIDETLQQSQELVYKQMKRSGYY